MQDNYSHSQKGVLRGLHFQIIKPQGKLVSCPKGAVFDVAIEWPITHPSLSSKDALLPTLTQLNAK